MDWVAIVDSLLIVGGIAFFFVFRWLRARPPCYVCPKCSVTVPEWFLLRPWKNMCRNCSHGFPYPNKRQSGASYDRMLAKNQPKESPP
jgi:hypothetical protein